VSVNGRSFACRHRSLEVTEQHAHNWKTSGVGRAADAVACRQPARPRPHTRAPRRKRDGERSHALADIPPTRPHPAPFRCRLSIEVHARGASACATSSSTAMKGNLEQPACWLRAVKCWACLNADDVSSPPLRPRRSPSRGVGTQPREAEPPLASASSNLRFLLTWPGHQARTPVRGAPAARG
jgi:hypothetical protein